MAHQRPGAAGRHQPAGISSFAQHSGVDPFSLEDEHDHRAPALPSLPSLSASYSSALPPAADLLRSLHTVHSSAASDASDGSGASASAPWLPLAARRARATPGRNGSPKAVVPGPLGIVEAYGEGEGGHPVDGVGEAGRGGDARRRGGGGGGGAVGVHGADESRPTDDAQRVVQIQTLGGEGVPSFWRRIGAKLGIRRRRPAGAFPSNELTTSKYTLLTFLPVNLFEQFKRVANLYFLLLVCLQAIPGLSPVPWWGTLFPLAVVLAVNAVKEAFDDYWRHKADEEVNHRTVTLVTEEGEDRILWKTVQVGDVLRLLNNEDVPADMVLLASSDPDGLCYVETANLDGESNLKAKFCHPGTASFDCAEAFSRAGYFTIECEAPNPRLYSFEGAIAQWDVPPSLALPDLSSGRPHGGAGAGGGGSGAQRSGSPARLRPGARAGGGRPGRAASGAAGGASGSGGGAAVPFSEQVGLLARDPLDVQNLLLRGSTLRKTEWVLAAVIYTGPDAKVVRNMLPAPRKVTQLERHMNGVVIATLIALSLASLALSIAHTWWELRHSSRRDWYLARQDAWPELAPGVAGFLVQLVRFVILMAQAVPISLYVTLELVKVVQCKLLYDQDRAMYDSSQGVPFASRTTTLNEELGQVQFILSDKTGTLTQNVMGFVWASIAGKLYGRGTAGASAALPPPGVPPHTPHSVVLDPELRRAAGFGVSATTAPNPQVAEFLLALALCNTVVPTVTEEGQLLYQAASPDEEALVAGAAYLGSKLLSRSAAGAEVEAGGRLARYETLAVLEFSSERKRMSVVVRAPDGGVRLYCKGADSALLPRLAAGGGAGGVLAGTGAHLEEMAGSGFRTLLVASRELRPEEFARWAADYKAASCAMSGREAAVASVCEVMERDLVLLGATAVEDKLQVGVPDAIATLRAAGIQVWVLTGDKVETAVSIAHTCRLVTASMGLLKLSERELRGEQPWAPASALVAAPPGGGDGEPRGLRRLWVALLRRYGGGSEASRRRVEGLSGGGAQTPAARVMGEMWQAVRSGRVRTQAAAAAAAAASAGANGGGAAVGGGGGSGGSGGSGAGVGLVIDGPALALALSPVNEDSFLRLCLACASVVCCRVSPMQKAQVASLVKAKAGAVTLAIGDGANDVSMIQAAHLGVGISGREGRAAVQASDYAFGQFRFLTRLLLVHGRQSYLRNREVVLYAFYKNIAYVCCFIVYTFYSGFSAQSIFFSAYIATFNSIWSAFPTIAYGVFEQDVTSTAAMRHPQLYADTRTQGLRAFVSAWLAGFATGLWHGVVCFAVPMRVLAGVSDRGLHSTVYVSGSAIMTAVVLVVALRVASRTTHWTAANHVAMWTTLLLWLPFLGLLGALSASVPGLAPLAGVSELLLAQPSFWLGAVLLPPCIALLPNLALMALQRHLWPRPSQLLQEAEQLAARSQRGGADVELHQGGAAPPQADAAPAPAAAPTAAGAALSGGIFGGADDNLLASGGCGAPELGGSGHLDLGVWGSAGSFDYGGAAGPRTLGGQASMEWGSRYLSASPQLLAQARTKRQTRAKVAPRPAAAADTSGPLGRVGSDSAMRQPSLQVHAPGHHVPAAHLPTSSSSIVRINSMPAPSSGAQRQPPAWLRRLQSRVGGEAHEQQPSRFGLPGQAGAVQLQQELVGQQQAALTTPTARRAPTPLRGGTDIL